MLGQGGYRMLPSKVMPFQFGSSSSKASSSSPESSPKGKRPTLPSFSFSSTFLQPNVLLSIILKKRKILFFCLVAVAAWSMTVNSNMERKARDLVERKEKQRELVTKYQGNGACDIGSPHADAGNQATETSTKTLLASYPGSGKRFLWTVVKALTDYEVADDWDYSGKLRKNPLSIKTSFPHKEGVWSWGTQMDQVMLLIRNPRRAIPSYHNMRWELNYAKSLGETYLRIPDGYFNLPSKDKWESWRNEKFNREIDAWYKFYDFWMQAGFQENTNETHPRCLYSEIECQPKELVDFDNVYSSEPTTDFQKIGDVLDSLNDVDTISEKARACVLYNVYNRSTSPDLNLHQSFGIRDYGFTITQFDRMYNRTINLRDKYSTEPYSLRPLAYDLVNTLNSYLTSNLPYYQETVDEFLTDFVKNEFGHENCTGLEEFEQNTCLFIKNRENHLIFNDDYFPDNVWYSYWLRERSILARIHISNGGDGWVTSTGWMSPDDHCTWYGVTCHPFGTFDPYSPVKSVHLSNNNLVGEFPTDLDKFERLRSVKLEGNAMYGSSTLDRRGLKRRRKRKGAIMSDNLCKKSVSSQAVYLRADAFNCPNTFDIGQASYKTGCCDFVLINMPIYLSYFVETYMGATDGDCDTLEGLDAEACKFIEEESNHDELKHGFPYEFKGNVWKWLIERTIVVKMYLSTQGQNWNTNTKWLESSNHCEWYGISCSTWNMMRSLNLEHNNMVGPFPSELGEIERFNTVKLAGNKMTGPIPDKLIEDSLSNRIYLYADSMNCPNEFDFETGQYVPGACNKMGFNVDHYLVNFVEGTLGDSNCDNLEGTEIDVCKFMIDKENHDELKNGYPYDFEGNLWKWLKERVVLVRMYLNANGPNWNTNTGWYGSTNHCDWYGIGCSYNMVRLMNLNDNNLGGSFPNDLGIIERFHTLLLEGNKMTGFMPEDICEISLSGRISVYGDAQNCPNQVDYSNGLYLPGCCNKVRINVDRHLKNFATGILGATDGDCDSFEGTEVDVCNFMINKDNHDEFHNGYPTKFRGNEWKWLKERSVVVRMYLNSGGPGWLTNTGWLENTNHCTWYGIRCSWNMIRYMNLDSNNLTGEFPSDLGDIRRFHTLRLAGNTMDGPISDQICSDSTTGRIDLQGDSLNCPNSLDLETGLYSSGCCNLVKINVDLYLREYATEFLGDHVCENLEGTEIDVCNFMMNKDNHGLFSDGYPTEFVGDVWQWLQERTILVRMYMNDSGDGWSVSTGWLSSDDHCIWHGISCGASLGVTEIILEKNQLIGPVPADLGNLRNLRTLNVHDNSLSGFIPNDLCTQSISNDMVINGDSEICPNDFQASTGEYLPGCCHNILIDVDIYLNHFAAAVLGDAKCRRLSGSESDVCRFMSDQANHAIFDNGYPQDFNGNVWQWVMERAILTRMFYNTGGESWTTNTGWLTKNDHCDWHGIVCTESNSIKEINLESNALSGPFPSDLGDLESLVTLNVHYNSLNGFMPSDLCAHSQSTSNMKINGDAENCPNDFQAATGEYLAGCCDNILIDVDIYLKHFTENVLGDANCNNLSGSETEICKYMSDKSNHGIFSNGFPYDFYGDVWEYIKERAILARVYFNHGGSRWIDNNAWLSSDTHCNWSGVVCSETLVVTGINLEGNQMTGPFPTALNDLNSLNDLKIARNTLTGSIPEEICVQSEAGAFTLSADAANCPNEFSVETHSYLPGCCDSVSIDVDLFLSHFVMDVLGDSTCSNLNGGVEIDVCNYMMDKSSHAIFSQGYPSDFEGSVWDFLTERSTLARMYINSGGPKWSHSEGWVGSDNHCTWFGIQCSTSHSVTKVNLGNNNLVGTYPNDLIVLTNMETLNLHGNSLEGMIPSDLCTRSTSSSPDDTNLYISGDQRNCPNIYDFDTVTVSNGCCDDIAVKMEDYLNQFTSTILGSSDCNSLGGGVDTEVCQFMVDPINHALFNSGYPLDFGGNVWEWLIERSILARLYLNNGGSDWIDNLGWLSPDNHCSWHRITCDESYQVKGLHLGSNNLSGPIPTYLSNLHHLHTLKVSSNKLEGFIPSDICSISESGTLHLAADHTNCPNHFIMESGSTEAGCCDEVAIDIESYLREFLVVVLGGNGHCDSLLAGVESDVCKFMVEKTNHDVFSEGYPHSFSGNVWEWLQERVILVRMHLSNGGTTWSNANNWLTPSNHCQWYGISCTDTQAVTRINLSNNLVSGSIPTDLTDLHSLSILKLGENPSLTGPIPESICTQSLSGVLTLEGDAKNCPNTFDVDTGSYIVGCCDSVHIDVNAYLNSFTSYFLGDANCDNWVGQPVSEGVCRFMNDRGNHEVLADGYPYDFSGNVWNYLMERAFLVKLYLTANGPSWTHSNNWLSHITHCGWNAVECNPNTNQVTSLHFENNNLVGVFPNNDLINLNSLAYMNFGSNELTGLISQELCDDNGLYIVADSGNCLNEFNTTKGEFLSGCCDNVHSWFGYDETS